MDVCCSLCIKQKMAYVMRISDWISDVCSSDLIGISHFILGMVKAPIFAFLIAAIGCNEGFRVSGSAQSVGEHTTSSVVQSIFVVIFLDALAALFYMEMGW